MCNNISDVLYYEYDHVRQVLRPNIEQIEDVPHKLNFLNDRIFIQFALYDHLDLLPYIFQVLVH